MATSSSEDAPRGMEFLYFLNRLNVATSRSRCATFIVASPQLLEPQCKANATSKRPLPVCRGGVAVLNGGRCSSDGRKSWIAKTVSHCSELRLNHTKSLKCSTPKHVPFLASRERNSEHPHRQPKAGRTCSTSVVPEPSASRITHGLRYVRRAREGCSPSPPRKRARRG
jgi:hypothetical protein